MSDKFSFDPAEFFNGDPDLVPTSVLVETLFRRFNVCFIGAEFEYSRHPDGRTASIGMADFYKGSTVSVLGLLDFFRSKKRTDMVESYKLMERSIAEREREERERGDGEEEITDL